MWVGVSVIVTFSHLFPWNFDISRWDVVVYVTWLGIARSSLGLRTTPHQFRNPVEHYPPSTITLHFLLPRVNTDVCRGSKFLG